jgi:hypothetical protein
VLHGIWITHTADPGANPADPEADPEADDRIY